MVNNSFNELWSIRPKEQGEVLVYDKELGKHVPKTIFRRYMSFGKVPNFDPKIKKSYMFTGTDLDNKSKEIPKEVQKHVPSKLMKEYNQVVVNWYDVGDYIEFHRDCDRKMVEDYKIAIINLEESDEYSTDFILKPVDGTNDVVVTLKNNDIFYLTPDLNRNYRHGLGPVGNRRISITLRQIKDEG